MKFLELQGMAVDGFAMDGPLQVAVKNILAQHADDNRRCRLAKGLGRPLDKLRKIIQERRLDLVFGRRRVLCEASEPQDKDQSQKEDNGSYWRGRICCIFIIFSGGKAFSHRSHALESI